MPKKKKRVPPEEWAAWLDKKIGINHVIAEFVNEGDLTFDIGANRGIRTQIFLNLGCRVVAVEPLLAVEPCPIPHLAYVFGEDERVTIVAKAISPRPDTVKLNVCTVFPGYSSVSTRWVKGTPKRIRGKWQEVPTTTLDALIAEHGIPTFMKIDVEDYESHVLRTLSQPVAGLSIEWHHKYLSDTEKCIEHLKALGEYRYRYTIGGSPGKWADEGYIDGDELLATLSAAPDKGPESWGEIYGRLTS